MNVISGSTVVLLAGLLFVACQEGGPETRHSPDAGNEAPVPAAAPQPGEAATSAGRPADPFRIDYAIIGTPVVGQPVSINLELSSSLRNRPVTLYYRINDARNLAFPEAQAQRVALAAFGETDRVSQQVTVVPQRDGRLYLNVYAEVETGEGTLMKSLAIPIQVGRAPGQQETNGESPDDSATRSRASTPPRLLLSR